MFDQSKGNNRSSKLLPCLCVLHGRHPTASARRSTSRDRTSRIAISAVAISPAPTSRAPSPAPTCGAQRRGREPHAGRALRRQSPESRSHERGSDHRNAPVRAGRGRDLSRRQGGFRLLRLRSSRGRGLLGGPRRAGRLLARRHDVGNREEGALPHVVSRGHHAHEHGFLRSHPHSLLRLEMPPRVG